METAPGQSIAILITTFNRNDKLLQLLAALRATIDAYRGPNRYFICVADSNPNNTVVLPGRVSHVVNNGSGFDDNLLGAFRFLSGLSDFIFAIADDDRPNPAVDMLAAIDIAAAETAIDVVLFNHLGFTGAGPIDISDRYFYTAAETVNLRVDPVPMLSWHMPRYTGILYRTAFIDSVAPQLVPLRGSLHAYAAPVYIAADRKRFLFIDHALTLFDDNEKSDGAWESVMKVHQGIMHFLKRTETCLSPGAHASLVRGSWDLFFRHDRKGIWRASLDNIPDFKSPEMFRAELAAWTEASAPTGHGSAQLLPCTGMAAIS